MRRQSADRLCAIDLFSGCGGLTLGLKQAGFDVLAAVELDAAAAKTYKANHKDVAVEQTDIRKLSAAGLRRQLGLRPGQLDLLAGCPPCQGFSILRTRNGANRNRDARNALIHEMLRFVRAFRPKAVMMENVPRLAQHRLFVDFCKGLRQLGYRLAFDIKDASLFGVPQRRRRLILLAGRGFDIQFAPEARRAPTVRRAIGRMSEPGRSRDGLHNFPEKKRTEKVLNLIRDIPKNGGSRSDLPRNRQLNCHKNSDGLKTFMDVWLGMRWRPPLRVDASILRRDVFSIRTKIVP